MTLFIVSIIIWCAFYSLFSFTLVEKSTEQPVPKNTLVYVTTLFTVFIVLFFTVAHKLFSSLV